MPKFTFPLNLKIPIALRRTGCSLLMVLPLLAPFPSAGAEVASPSESKPVTAFEGPDGAANIKVTSATFRLVTDGVTEGKQALLMKFDPPHSYPAVIFTQPTPLNLSGTGGLAFDLYNPGEDAARFGVRLDSDTNGKTEMIQATGAIDGKEKASFAITFGADPKSLGMASLPGSGNYRNLGGGGALDLAHIVSWQIFGVRPWTSFSLIIDNARAIPAVKQDFNKIVDQYGQYTRTDWPGKVKSNADFNAQLTQEEVDLKEHREVSGRDKYGGWSAGPQLKATGFFRVEKYQGKWAFVDPDGHLFLSFGPTSVAPAQATPLAGREYMFATPPKEDPVLRKYISDNQKQLDLLGANLERKYGADFKRIWLERTYRRLRSWGFNTIAAFSSWDTLANGQIPYTVTIWPGDRHARIATTDKGDKVDDPFDPQFAVSVANAVKGQASRVKEDPYCLGYFVGNEEKWGHFRNGDRSHYSVPLAALGSRADASPAKRAFLAQLQAKYGDIAKLNAAWATNYANWASLNEPVKFKDPLSEAVMADLSAMLKSFGQEYFRTVQSELKKADPDHLYLGCRFAGYSTELLEGISQHCDVMSFNVYRLSVDPKEFTFLEAYDRPVVIGEFHFGSLDRGMFNGGLVSVVDQAARGRAYQNYLRSILEHPKFIGAHWFQYTDQPTIGRYDGENANCGFVSITDTSYPELITAARQVHSEMYLRRFGQK